MGRFKKSPLKCFWEPCRARQTVIFANSATPRLAFPAQVGHLARDLAARGRLSAGLSAKGPASRHPAALAAIGRIARTGPARSGPRCRIGRRAAGGLERALAGRYPTVSQRRRPAANGLGRRESVRLTSPYGQIDSRLCRMGRLLQRVLKPEPLLSKLKRR